MVNVKEIPGEQSSNQSEINLVYYKLQHGDNVTTEAEKLCNGPLGGGPTLLITQH